MASRLSRHERTNAFWAAWAFLVLAVSLAFYVQARTIDRLEADENVIRTRVEQSDVQQTKNIRALCGLLVAHADDEREIRDIVDTFATMGYSCPQREV